MGRPDQGALVDCVMNRVYLITLARAEARRESVIRKLSEAGIPYRMVEADDGEDPSLLERCEVDFEAFLALHGRDILPGEIGCYLSHLRALEAITSSGDDYGIVMEDDIDILWDDVREIEAAIDRAVSGAPGFSLIYPGFTMFDDFTYDGSLSTESPARMDRAPSGTQCYIASKEFALHFVTSWRTIYRPVDGAFGHLSKDGRFPMFHAPEKDRWCGVDFSHESMIAKPAGLTMAP